MEEGSQETGVTECARESSNGSPACETGLNQADPTLSKTADKEESNEESGKTPEPADDSKESAVSPANGDEVAEVPAEPSVAEAEEGGQVNDKEPVHRDHLAANEDLPSSSSGEVAEGLSEGAQSSPVADDRRSPEAAPPSRDSRTPEASPAPSGEGEAEVNSERSSTSSGTGEQRPVGVESPLHTETDEQRPIGVESPSQALPSSSRHANEANLCQEHNESRMNSAAGVTSSSEQSGKDRLSLSSGQKPADPASSSKTTGKKTLRELAEEEDEPMFEEQSGEQAKESEQSESTTSSGGKSGGLRRVPPTGDMAKAAMTENADSSSPQIHQGKLFEAAYLGSTQIVVQLPLSKSMRVTQAYEAVSRVKQPDGESQPMIPVQLEVSTESIKIINAADKVVLMDHPLRSISYVADIGKLVIIMARRRLNESDDRRARESGLGPGTAGDRRSKLLCHVLEAEEAHHVSETIGLAFNCAYRQFLRHNGIDEEALAVSDYADILSVQRMPQDDLQQFVSKEGEKEVQISKRRGEILGISVMESGWGSLVPSVMVVHMQPGGAASRSGVINVGDQLTAITGKSLVGLSLTKCLEIIKGVRPLTTVKIRFVKTTPVLDVNIVRPDSKFPLGFSVAEGTITSLLRGSIGERGGIRVGHRIIEMNGQSTINMPPGQLVDMLQEKTGHIQLKTMPLHMFRIVTGQLVPEYI